MGASWGLLDVLWAVVVVISLWVKCLTAPTTSRRVVECWLTRETRADWRVIKDVKSCRRKGLCRAREGGAATSWGSGGEDTGDEDMKRPSTESPRCMAKDAESLRGDEMDTAGEGDSGDSISTDGPRLSVASEEGVRVPDDSSV